MNVSKRNACSKKLIFYLMFIFYLVLIIRIILFKDIPLNKILSLAGSERSINIIPIKSILQMFLDEGISTEQVFKNIGGNIAIFIPMGIFIPLLFDKYSFKITVITGIVVSLIFEALQYILAVGVTDIDDIILNTFGTLIGWFVFYSINKLKIVTSKKIYIYTLILILGGGISIFLLLLNDSDILFNFDKKIQISNGELVDHLEVECPDVYGKFIEYENSKVILETTRKNSENIIGMSLDDKTNIYVETYESHSFLNQIVEENITYKQISLEEFQKSSENYNENNNVSIWSNDGKKIDDLLVIIWNFN